MEMLIFFFLSLFGGIVAAYLMEKSDKSQNGLCYFEPKRDIKATFSRLSRLSRQM